MTDDYVVEDTVYPDCDEGPSGRYGLPFYGRSASMVRATAGNLQEQNKNNECVNRLPETVVKKRGYL